MRFRPSAKRTSPFKSQSVVQSTTCSRCVRISGSNAGYTMLRSNLKSIRHPLHSPGSPSLPIPCVTVCHHISIGLCMQQPTYCSSDRHFARINQNKTKKKKEKENTSFLCQVCLQRNESLNTNNEYVILERPFLLPMVKYYIRSHCEEILGVVCTKRVRTAL